MKLDVIEKLGQARDFHSLTSGLLALCEPFGAVHSLRVVHNRGAERVACSIELESAKQQPALARALGARLVGGAVCLDVPVRKEFARPGKVVAIVPQAAEFDGSLTPPPVGGGRPTLQVRP
jgi:hypothetical protein